METVGQQLIIAAIPVLPALVFFALVLLGRLLGENAQYVAILGVTISLVFSVFALLYVAGIIPGGGQPIEFAVNWINLGEGGSFSMGVYIDSLAAVMLVVVCFVSLMIQLYSGGFMEGDSRFAWYYAVLNLFTASMLGLVVSPNFIELYVFWALVGEALGQGCGSKSVHRHEDRRRCAVRRDHHLLGQDGDDVFRWYLRGGPGRVYRGVALYDCRGAGLYRSCREERAVPAARVVAGRDGGPYAGLRADPRRDDGRSGRVPRGTHVRHLRPERVCDARRSVHRGLHGTDGGDDGAGQEGHKARHRVLDGLTARVHDAGPGDRVVHGGHLPPLQPRLLQGATVPVRRQHHLRDGQLQPLRDGWLETQDAAHLLGYGGGGALALGDLPLQRFLV